MPDELNLPSVGVVIPYYNQADMIEAVLLQHLNQTLRPCEIIVVDYGSTDGGIERIKPLQQKFPIIRIERLKKNMGVNNAINHGLLLIRSSYVKISACDDIVEPTLLESSMKILAKHPYAAFSFSQPGEYLSVLGKNEKYAFYLTVPRIQRYFSPKEISILLRKHFSSFPSNSCVFNMAALRDVGLFQPSLGLGADWFACLVMAFRNGVCFIPENLTWFCKRDDSYSAIGLEDKRQQLSNVKRILDMLLESDFQDIRIYFKKSCVFYENSFQSLIFLIKNKKYHYFLSMNLFLRLFIKSSWRLIRTRLSAKTRLKICKLRNWYN